MGAVGTESSSPGEHAGATADGVDVAVTRADGVVRYELTVRPRADVNRL